MDFIQMQPYEEDSDEEVDPEDVPGMEQDPDIPPLRVRLPEPDPPSVSPARPDAPLEPEVMVVEAPDKLPGTISGVVGFALGAGLMVGAVIMARWIR